MVRRYAPACLLIMAISLGSAPLAYKASVKEGFRTFCTFEVVVRAPQTAAPPATSEFIKFTNTLAANLISAAAPTVYAEVAKVEKVKAAAIQRQVKITNAPGLGAAAIVVNDTQAKRAIRRANAVCTQYVATIKKQRSDQVNADIAVLQGRIDSISKDLAKLLRISPSRRSTVDKALIISHTRAINTNGALIAALRSGVPDKIAAVAPAENVTKTSTASLRKNFIIAAVAGVLVCFLIILIGEAVAERRLLRVGPARTE
jgi:hypothetical protein